MRINKRWGRNNRTVHYLGSIIYDLRNNSNAVALLIVAVLVVVGGCFPQVFPGRFYTETTNATITAITYEYVGGTKGGCYRETPEACDTLQENKPIKKFHITYAFEHDGQQYEKVTTAENDWFVGPVDSLEAFAMQTLYAKYKEAMEQQARMVIKVHYNPDQPQLSSPEPYSTNQLIFIKIVYGISVGVLMLAVLWLALTHKGRLGTYRVMR